MKNGLTSVLYLLLLVYPAELVLGTSAPSPCEGAYSAYHEITRIDQVEDRLWAVNATNYPPADGVLKPRLGPTHMSPTLHFSIGELVPPHENGSWEEKKYAFLIPLKELYSRTLNLMALDTFILGGIKLPKEAVMVAPRGTTVVPPGVKVFEYDPARTTLRQAVDAAIEAQGGIKLATSNGSGGESSTKVLFEQAIRESQYGWDAKGPNVNTVDFLGSALKKYPWISFGTHNRSVTGDAGRLGQISYFLQLASKSGAIPTERLAFLLTLTEANLKALDKTMARMPLPPDSKAFYKAYRVQVDEVTKRLRAELASRPKSGETSSVTQVNGAYFGLNSDYLRINLSSLKFEDLKDFAADLERTMPGLLETLGGQSFLKLSWAYGRFDILSRSGTAGNALMEKENLKAIYRDAYQESEAWIATLPDKLGRDARDARRILVQSIPFEWKQ